MADSVVDPVNPGLYTVGGTVQANEGGIYISRRADRELLQLCEESTFAYVLTPRQMGKSSLMTSTAERLIDAGKQAVIVDLTQLGTQLSADEWYSDFLYLVASQLMLATNVKRWWQDNAQSGLALRLTRFFQEVVLAEVSEPIVVFVDEIDTTLSLNFTDDFYAAIRYLYVARSTDSRLRRLSFVLIGVATPADLIQDPKRTPFNIGQRVDLTDFTAQEALPLAAGLGLVAEKERQMLEEVLYWTGGHPYLTQRLCRALVDRSPQGWTAAAVGPVVAETFLGGMSEQDNNLQFVRDMLTKRAPKPLAQGVLTTYRDIYRSRQPVFDEEQNLVKSHLKLSGVVRREGKRLQVRNRIYCEVFSPQWIRKHLPQSFWQRYRPVLQWVIPVMLASVLAIVVMAGLVQEAERQKTIAQLSEQAAQVLNLIPTTNAVSGLVLAIDTMDQSWSLPSVAMAAQSNLLKAVQVSREINRLAGHEDWVMSVAFSSDGQRIVSSSRDGTLRLWNAQTGASIGQPFAAGDRDGVYSVALSPNGQRIVSGSNDGTLRLWNAPTGAPIGQPLAGDGNVIGLVAFSPDGQRIVSGSNDNTLRLWNAQTGASIGQPLTGDGFSVAFSPDGQRIVSGSNDNTLRLWNAQTGTSIGQPLVGHENSIYSVAFSSDGQRIVSGSNDHTLRLWNAQTGTSIGQPLVGHGGAVYAVAFSPNGQSIVSGSDDKTLRLWDTQTGAPIGQPLLGHRDWVHSVAFSPDGQRIVSGSNDGTLRLWDAQTDTSIGQPLLGHEDGVNSVAFSPDGQRIVSGSDDKTLRLWDAHTGNSIGQPLLGHEDGVNSVALSPDGQRIVSGSNDKTLRLWDAHTGDSIGQPLEGHKGEINSVVFSPDGQHIISGGNRDDLVRFWDARTGVPIGQQPFVGVLSSDVDSVAFSPDGQRIAISGFSNRLWLWDAQTGTSISQPLEGNGDWIFSLAFSPDGQRIVSGSNDNALWLWDAQTGTPIGQPLEGHKDWVHSVAFSPNGQRIVSGSRDHTLRLWDAQTGALIGQSLEGHKDWVDSVAFSPDGQHIVSGSSDHTLRLWNVSQRLGLTWLVGDYSITRC